MVDIHPSPAKFKLYGSRTRAYDRWREIVTSTTKFMSEYKWFCSSILRYCRHGTMCCFTATASFSCPFVKRMDTLFIFDRPIAQPMKHLYAENHQIHIQISGTRLKLNRWSKVNFLMNTTNT